VARDGVASAAFGSFGKAFPILHTAALDLPPIGCALRFFSDSLADVYKLGLAEVQPRQVLGELAAEMAAMSSTVAGMSSRPSVLKASRRRRPAISFPSGCTTIGCRSLISAMLLAKLSILRLAPNAW
jgi:hypothetical protein